MPDDDLTVWSVPAETREWLGPITATANDIPTTAFEVTLTAPGVRPFLWQTPMTIASNVGLLVGTETDFPLSPGRKYTLWVRFHDDPEQPVVRAGFIRAT